jgi:hypothetical protein
MPHVNLEHDPLFQLLTDALRAGPESAEWREAVQRVAERGEAADEFTLLCKARERLAQGKEYKSVRPGPTFTRNVMTKIDEEASQAKRGVPWASVIAIVSFFAIIVVVAAIAYMVTSRSDVITTPKPASPATSVSPSQDR